MLRYLDAIRHSLVSKIILAVGLTLIFCLAGWALIVLHFQTRSITAGLTAESDRLSNAIKLSTRRAMMLNSRDDLAEIINDVGRLPEIENIRIYNKQGQIKFSNNAAEIDRKTNIKAEACFICHRSEPPLTRLDLSERSRIFHSGQGYRLLGILSPIYNEPGCATSVCHVHPGDKQVLGALDVVFSLKDKDREMMLFKRTVFGLTLLVLVLTSTVITWIVFRFVRQPVSRLITGTQMIAQGNHFQSVEVDQDDEMGLLARAINQMGEEIFHKQAELNRQRDEYQRLFEIVPCIITVQDRDYRLIQYNREFSEKFDPLPDDYCYHAFKGRDHKCGICPVEKTFADGRSHQSEESGLNRDGTVAHWIAITSPIKNSQGETVAAMEVSLDITQRKQLEDSLEASEKKYHAIFHSMPNPVFVLDMETLEILDCNDSVRAVYGYERREMIGRSFKDLSAVDDETHVELMAWHPEINQVRHLNKSGRAIFVNLRLSPSEFHEQNVILVTASDITKRLETEHQLHQASKLATLGEMATGVAHELNQPLSVIKTASSFYLRKIRKNEPFDLETLKTMIEKVDQNVDRATRIITHMRTFARKSYAKLVPIQVNEIMEKAVDIFSQQLRVRGIEVRWDLEASPPRIMADPDRLEQVFINLLINARDALAGENNGRESRPGDRHITLRTRSSAGRVFVEVADNGPGVKEEHKDKLFDPFFTTKEVGQGTGLGLSISYGIVKECGGEIRVESQEGRGACFIIEFPIKGAA
ncbi:MAG: PAS domain S-box protein [Proteobacteria bacterium]|nr:PAS domain S-box protein [Pseudomonadota bacterium]